MSAQSKTALNSTIDSQITTNGSNDITGAQLNSILGNMVDSYEDFVGSYTTVQIAALVGMTLRQRVFNTTDNDYEYYDGTRWVKEAHPKYKVYTALLTQTGTNAPTAIVLENTLGGTPVWSYDSTGTYLCTLASAFTDLKTFSQITNANGLTVVSCSRDDDNTMRINTYYDNAGTFQAGNAYLTKTSIEIRVYY